MSHAITRRSNGKSEMAYVGAKPWHGLGQELPEGQTIEQWCAAAGMDWKIQRSRVRFATGHNMGGDAELATWDDYHVLMRSDSKLPLGMVSDRFKIVQPKEILEFFRDLVDVAGFKLITAGTLYGGKRFWAQADIKTEDRIVGLDMVKGRLLAATACDGSMRTVVKNCAERTVCANTLHIAMGEKGAPEVSISHKSTFDAKAVKEQLGLSVNSFHKFISDARQLAARKVSKAEADEFVRNIMCDELDMKEALTNRSFNNVMNLFNGEGRGATLPGVKNTAWGLLNSVTEFYDHHYGRTDDARMNSAWFGVGNDRKQKAMAMAMNLVK